MSNSSEIVQSAFEFLRAVAGPGSLYSMATIMGAPDLGTLVLEWCTGRGQPHQAPALLEYLQRTYTTAPVDACPYLVCYPPPKVAQVCILRQLGGGHWIKWLDSPRGGPEAVYQSLPVEKAHSLIRHHGYTLVPARKSTLPLS